MKSAIVFVTVLLFFLGLTSIVYSGLAYTSYRELIPHRRPVGLLTAIRTWTRAVHNLDDPDVSDECKKILDALQNGEHGRRDRDDSLFLFCSVAENTWHRALMLVPEWNAFELLNCRALI